MPGVTGSEIWSLEGIIGLTLPSVFIAGTTGWEVCSFEIAGFKGTLEIALNTPC